MKLLFIVFSTSMNENCRFAGERKKLKGLIKVSDSMSKGPPPTAQAVTSRQDDDGREGGSLYK